MRSAASSRSSRSAAAAASHANASVGYGTFDTSSAAAGVSGGSGAARGSVQIAGRRSDGFNAIVNPANFSYDPDRDGYRDASVSAYGELRFMPEHALSAQYFTSRLDNQFDAGDTFDDRTVTTLAMWQVATDRSVHTGMDVANIGGRRQRQVGVEERRSAISRSRRTSGNTRGKTTSCCRQVR